MDILKLLNIQFTAKPCRSFFRLDFITPITCREKHKLLQASKYFPITLSPNLIKVLPCTSENKYPTHTHTTHTTHTHTTPTHTPHTPHTHTHHTHTHHTPYSHTPHTHTHIHTHIIHTHTTHTHTHTHTHT